MRQVTAILLSLGLCAAAGAFEVDGYLMEPAEERRLAATAGPASVTDGATYYRLTPTGFQLDAQGSNGWHCFVERAFFVLDADGERDASVRAPHCINAVGARSRMQEIFLRTRLALTGASREQVDAEVNAAFASGELQPPDGFALTYMMSAEQHLGTGVGAWKPHLMIWVPYLTNAEVGSNPSMGELPFIATDSGTRGAVLVVPVAPLD